MIQRMLASALIAGFAAGLLAAVLHFALIQELIFLGEKYETGALVHFAGAGELPPVDDMPMPKVRPPIAMMTATLTSKLTVITVTLSAMR